MVAARLGRLVEGSRVDFGNVATSSVVPILGESRPLVSRVSMLSVVVVMAGVVVTSDGEGCSNVIVGVVVVVVVVVRVCIGGQPSCRGWILWCVGSWVFVEVVGIGGGASDEVAG